METSIAVVGVNHQTSSVGVREGLAPKPEENGRLNASILAAAGLSEGVALATCSRFEVYARGSVEETERLKASFSTRAGRPVSEHVYVKRGPEAIKHLMRVTAGLDSWVIGETEILGQVKAAYQKACEEKTATRPFHIAFQRAIMVGKKIRTETSIVGGIKSIGGAAMILAQRVFNTLAERRVVVFGAGSMAESTVRHLRSKGIGDILVANRSEEKARALAEELGGRASGLDEGFRRLVEADVAVFSTGATRHIFDAAAARELSRSRGGRPIFVIDLGLPRNVDPGAAKAEGVFVYDMDDLRRLVEESLKRRESDLARAEAVVDDETADCWARIHPPPAVCPLRVKLPALQAS